MSTRATEEQAGRRAQGERSEPMATRVAAATCTRCEVHAESVFKVEGLCCSEEVTILERRLKPLRGMEDLVADVMGQRLHVKYDAAVLSTATISDAVAETGMRAWLEHEEPVLQPSSRARERLVQVSAAALVLGLVAQALSWPVGVQVASFLAATIAGGVYPARKAMHALRQRTVDINVLMLIAAVGAMVLGEWAEAGTVVFLFAIAQWLESRTMDRAREAIRALMDLTPAEARIKHDAHEHPTPVDRVAIGAVMIVRPGEKIPLDGRVLTGASEVNQAPITGESLPVDKTTGDDVFAGTINGHGALEVEVTRRRRDTTLARIIHLVETAQSQRAPAHQFIDRFARWYTPAVIAMAVLVALVPPLALGQPSDPWLYRALVLLVVACPCALVISTPVSIVAALAGAARHGVLIKGGAHLEQLAAVRAMAFDKTGTLTKGELHVSDVKPIQGGSEDPPLQPGEGAPRGDSPAVASSNSFGRGGSNSFGRDGSNSLGRGGSNSFGRGGSNSFGRGGSLDPPAMVLAIAAAVEARSEHPMARAIHRAAHERGLMVTPSTDVRALPGLGAEGTVEGEAVLCGSLRLFRERNLLTPAVEEVVNAVAASGASAVLVARAGQTIGVIGVADRVREGAADVIDLLHGQGIKPIVMLTGDHAATARAVASRVGVDDVRAELLPEDKVRVLREIKMATGSVAMVGDGVNDAPALASADVSIAMGAIGSDAALETADIALMSDDLTRIPYAVRLSRATVRNIHTNVAISLALKAAFLVLAVTGVATLWMAVIADTGASVIVIANALRLLKKN